MAISKDMYGLTEAGILANKLLRSRFSKFRYFKLPHTPGLWKHISRPISCTLVVDNLGIKYIGREHANHLIKALQKDYSFKVDETGNLYCGINLDCQYDRVYVDTSMPTYVGIQLTQYGHEKPERKTYSPYAPAATVHGKSMQDMPEPDTSPALYSKGKL